MLVNTMDSQTRNIKAAKKFFGQVKSFSHKPDTVITDGHGSYPRAISRQRVADTDCAYC